MSENDERDTITLDGSTYHVKATATSVQLHDGDGEILGFTKRDWVPFLRFLISQTPELAEVLAGDRRDPLGALVRTEVLERIAASLDRRPAEIREMFSLRFEQDLRIREIADLIGISHAAAKQRFARTLREIRRELMHEPGAEEGGRTCAMAD